MWELARTAYWALIDVGVFEYNIPRVIREGLMFNPVARPSHNQFREGLLSFLNFSNPLPSPSSSSDAENVSSAQLKTFETLLSEGFDENMSYEASTIFPEDVQIAKNYAVKDPPKSGDIEEGTMVINAIYDGKGVTSLESLLSFEVKISNPKETDIITLLDNLEGTINRKHLAHFQETTPNLESLVISKVKFSPSTLSYEGNAVFRDMFWGKARHETLYEISGGRRLL